MSVAHNDSTYTNHGCRCGECRAAHALYMAGFRDRLHHRMLAGEVHPTHGTHSTYVNYRCRCDDCRRANRDCERLRRERVAS